MNAFFKTILITGEVVSAVIFITLFLDWLMPVIESSTDMDTKNGDA